MKNNLSTRLGRMVGLALAPLILFLLIHYILPNNPGAGKYVSRYLENSRLIEIEATGEYKEKAKTYGDKYSSKKNRGYVTMTRQTFYSETYNKYFSFYSFEGAGLDHKTMPTSKMYFDDLSVYIAFTENLTVVASVNNDQLNDPDYGTEKKPLPLFGVNLLEQHGPGLDDSYIVDEVVNHVYVEQYLKHFMSRKEFKRMFRN